MNENMKDFLAKLKKFCDEATYVAQMHIDAGETSFSGIRDIINDISTIVDNKMKEI